MPCDWWVAKTVDIGADGNLNDPPIRNNAITLSFLGNRLALSLKTSSTETVYSV
jgi:hypothetical protein